MFILCNFLVFNHIKVNKGLVFIGVYNEIQSNPFKEVLIGKIKQYLVRCSCGSKSSQNITWASSIVSL